ncbi:SRPBCC family protein [Arenimonas sp.]|uniref:SRPBCC family protein n=1 Tax=Arenimonas sp. TaxID=1872635 RepID=UPI002E34C5EA|nr:SRPBCC family protein [Arenimonas sp.]HEX4852713.1 SRPBCC family protein [Arenimonas sp.]
MTRVIEWIISLLIVIALFVVIGLFLPASRTVSHSVETNRPMSTVNDILSSFTRFKDWNALINHDPRMQLTASGPESGVGAALAFSSSQHSIGSGKWEIKEIVPGEKIVYALDTPGRGKNKTMTFRFERTGQRNQNIEITQRYSVDYGYDLLGRYAGTLYVNSEVGADIKRGLTKLSNLLATIPRFDYSQHEPGFEIAELPAQNVLLVTTAAKRANDDIALAMTNQRKWIDQVMEKNELEPAGPMRIVTNEFGSDSYAFDVVMPIRRKGTGPAAPAAADGEAGEAAEAVAEAAPAPAPAVDPNAPLETFEVEVEGPVVYAQLPAMRVAKSSYVGPSPGLARIRDLVRAWALVRGHEPTDRPFEEYLGEIKDMLAEDAEFNVYWPVVVPGVDAPAPRVIAPLPEDEAAEPAPAAEEAEAEAAAA